MHYAGIDIGAATAKAVIVDREGRVAAHAVSAAGYNRRAAAEAVFADALRAAGLEAAVVAFVVATGYGRGQVDFAARTFTEIRCHARGARALLPEARTVIDIGGQDSKVIALEEGGAVRDFAMNDKCAAGTGRFLEVMARALEADADGLQGLAARSRAPVPISSTCAVFAESEVVSRLASGAAREDIAAGIHEAVASRIRALAGTLAVRDAVALTGGVSRNGGVVRALEAALGRPVLVPPLAQAAGALGAALFALSMAGEGA